ncbi:MAG TPA: gamma-glutamylcyclotransferase family protein [Gammaproteobacteria bacterium]|jgi:gamma-glutamylcyclotransferase (GGCT)/AIG2-like uncharacterized protein YtfP
MSGHRRAPRALRHIVLYGTLRAGHTPHARLKLRSALVYVGKCTLQGTLYDLGSYPGFVPGTGTAEGEVYRIKNPARLARLDAFEGYDREKPERSRYLREVVGVPRALGNGVRLRAWIYVYNGATAGRREVPGGVWPRGRRNRSRP